MCQSLRVLTPFQKYVRTTQSSVSTVVSVATLVCQKCLFGLVG